MGATNELGVPESRPREIDIGQGEVDWVVMSDPDDNEFCVLSTR